MPSSRLRLRPDRRTGGHGVRALASGAALLLAITACGSTPSGSSGASPDASPIMARSDVVADTPDLMHAQIQLPTGLLDVSVTPPRAELASSDTGDGQAHEAPDGGSLIGLDWTLQKGVGVPPGIGPLVEHDHVEPEVTLTTDGGTYPVPQGDQFVPVSGSGGATGVTVTFDGVDLSVPLPEGQMSSLGYRLRRSSIDGHDCNGRVRVDPGRATTVCSYGSGRVPYVTGLGWRDGGWLVVELDITTGLYYRGSRLYSVLGSTEHSTLDGTPPRRVVHELGGPGALTDLLVFADASGGRLMIDRTARARPALKQGRGRDQVRLTGVVSLH